jgi:hypothetical protein
MHRLVRAVAGGAAGTALLSLLLLMLEVETRSAVEIFAAIARFAGVPGDLALGFVLFALAGGVGWPLLFAAVERGLPLEDPATRGMVFALPLWAAFVVVGRGDLAGSLLAVYASFTLLAHLAYGYTLGAVYDRLADPEEVVVRRADA